MPSYRTIPKLLQTSTCQENLIERGYYEQDVNFSYRQTADAHDSQTTTNATMALIKSLKGRSIAWNQLVQNGDFSDGTTGWATSSEVVQYVDDGILTMQSNTDTSTAKFSYRFVSAMNLTVGHFYLISAEIKVESASTVAMVCFSKNSNAINLSTERVSPLTYTRVSAVGRHIETDYRFTLRLQNNVPAGGTANFRNVMVIDLTLIYGEGNEPSTAEEFEQDYFNWFGKPLTYEAYTAGELRNLNMVGIKTQGFNLLGSNGTCQVIGGTQYQLTGTYTGIADSQGTAITPDAQGLFTPTENTEVTVSGVGSDTCLHFVHSGRRNGEYEEHWEETQYLDLTKVQGKLDGTGSSVYVCPQGLLQAGDVRDEIYVQDGKRWLAKRVGQVDLGTLTWTYRSNYKYFNSKKLSIPIKAPEGAKKVPILCSIYEGTGNKTTETDIDKVVWSGRKGFDFNAANNLIIRDLGYTDATVFKSAMDGVYLNYELATSEYYLLDDEWQDDAVWSYKVDDWGTEEVVNSSIGISTPIEGTIKYYNPLRQYSYGLRQNEIACIHDAQVVKDIYKNGTLSLHNNIWDFFPVNSALLDDGKERYFRIYSTIEGVASKPSILNIGSDISSVKIVDKSNDGNYIVGVKTNGEIDTDATKYAVTLMNDYGVSFKIYLLPSDYWSIGEMTFSNATTQCEYFFIGSSATLTVNSLDPGYIFRAPRLQGYNFSKLATYSNPTYGFPESSTVTFTYPVSYPYSVSDSYFSPIHVVDYDLSASDLDSVYTPMYSYNSEQAKGADGAHPSNFVTGQYIYIVKRTGKLLTVQNNNSSNNGFTIYSAQGVPEYSKVTINLSTGGLSNTTLA